MFFGLRDGREFLAFFLVKIFDVADEGGLDVGGRGFTCELMEVLCAPLGKHGFCLWVSG